MEPRFIFRNNTLIGTVIDLAGGENNFIISCYPENDGDNQQWFVRPQPNPPPGLKKVQITNCRYPGIFLAVDQTGTLVVASATPCDWIIKELNQTIFLGIPGPSGTVAYGTKGGPIGLELYSNAAHKDKEWLQVEVP